MAFRVQSSETGHGSPLSGLLNSPVPPLPSKASPPPQQVSSSLPPLLFLSDSTSAWLVTLFASPSKRRGCFHGGFCQAGQSLILSLLTRHWPLLHPCPLHSSFTKEASVPPAPLSDHLSSLVTQSDSSTDGKPIVLLLFV